MWQAIEKSKEDISSKAKQQAIKKNVGCKKCLGIWINAVNHNIC